MADNALLVVPDATQDRRFREHPLVTGDPQVRFYAGAPLRVSGGQPIGTLCLLDTVPRSELSGDERQLLTDLAEAVVGEFELRRVLAERSRSEALLTAILEAALDSVITIDRESRITEWNPAAERMFGYRRDEVLGQELAELIIPACLRSAHQQGMACYLHSGEGPVLGRRVEVPAPFGDPARNSPASWPSHPVPSTGRCASQPTCGT